LPNIIGRFKLSRMRWEDHVRILEEKRKVHRILEGKQQRYALGRPRHRWKDNIKTRP
jgi:hypothetical protein